MNGKRNARRARKAPWILMIVMSIILLGCGIIHLTDALGGYRQGESHQMQDGTAALALEAGFDGGARPLGITFPENWPAGCTNLPVYMACRWSKNIKINSAHPANEGFDVPFAVNNWSIRKAWGTVSYVPPATDARVTATVYGGPNVLYTLAIEAHASECVITIDSPNGPKGQALKSCTVPVPQMTYDVNLPASPLTILFEKAEGAAGSTLSINLTVEYDIPPAGAITFGTPDPDKNAIPQGCTTNTPRGSCTVTLEDLWGLCTSQTTPSRGGFKTVITVTIKGVQTAQNSKCFALFPKEAYIESIRGTLGYKTGGDGRASMNFWLYVDEYSDLMQCCDGSIIYGAKIAVPKAGVECLIHDPNPDPKKRSCIIPIEGVSSPPISFNHRVPARKLTLWFNSDLDTAHPSRDEPDVITLTIFSRVSF